MAEENEGQEGLETQDTSTETQDTAGEAGEAQTGQEAQEGTGKLSKEALQQIASMTGRLIKKQIDESVLPQLEGFTRKPAIANAEEGSALQKFNQQLQEKIFEGDVLGALQMANNIQTAAKQNIDRQNKSNTDKQVVSYADKPYYEDIYQDMKTIAHQAVQDGFPPEAAAKYAYATAKANHLSKLVGGGKDADTGNLAMTTGGKRTTTTKKPKLPPQFKAAYERDKAKGLFKDEAEFISYLSPSVREQYGI